MKTNEELKAMTHDELVEYAEKLQKDLKSSRDSTLFYSEEKNKIEKKFDNFKNLVKSLVVLVD
ncbi:hypothetical protein DWZ34_10840 [Phocaeicola plebeius]|jgi:hypothetical protein|uniref:Uncharacterized protein n=1 Tax=Phocaeicola plebeius TaxID=310297 RepID=A0A415T2K2_9BACT|nr:hypothetical protein [Phocaeicola plebeius]RHM95715.1 hypothetical protein DWZ34_10840 [Phocaeicola plebeius]